jgi:hypothetical protein
VECVEAVGRLDGVLRLFTSEIAAAGHQGRRPAWAAVSAASRSRAAVA